MSFTACESSKFDPNHALLSNMMFYDRQSSKDSSLKEMSPHEEQL